MTMKIRSRRQHKCAIGLLLCLLLAGLAHHYFVINTTRSFPPGIYRKTHEKPVKNSLVLFCPPRLEIFAEARRRRFLGAGICPSGTDSMIKKIVAVYGDHICITSEGISINGIMQENSKPLITMEYGIKLPLNRILTEKEVLFISPHPLSFDGRYFGTLQASVIETTLQPLWLWED